MSERFDFKRKKSNQVSGNSRATKKKYLLSKFRTITTLLQHLQPLAGTDAIYRRMPQTDHSKEDRYDLRFLTSLATVLVRNRHEITAVIGSDIGRIVELLVTHAELNSSDINPKPIIATSNPFRDKPDIKESSSHIRLKEDVVLMVLEPRHVNLSDPLDFLVNRKIDDQPFHEHVATIITIINEYIKIASRTDLVAKERAQSAFMHYVLAASSPKMLERLTFNSSVIFLRVLNSLPSDQLASLEMPSLDILPADQIRRDDSFLRTLTMSSAKQILGGQIGISLLLAAAQFTTAHTRSFYTANNATEFHALLVFLLKKFKDDVKTVADLVHATPSESRFNDLVLTLAQLNITASLLWLLIHTSAMEIHIMRITPYLAEKLREENSRAIPTSFILEGEDPNDDIDGIDDAVPVEGHSKPSSKFDKLQRWQRETGWSYMRWFRRQVIPVEAVEIICHLAKKLTVRCPPLGAPQFTIKLLDMEHVDNQMQMWEKVVRDIVVDMKDINADDIVKLIVKLKPMFADRKLTFGGNLHCEACLASLRQSVASEDLKSIKENVIGVSKRCCPVCIELLELLFKERRSGRATVHGSHQTYYACALPPWLPFPVIEEMVEIFEGFLKDVLRNLILQPKPSRTSGETAGMSDASSEAGVDQPGPSEARLQSPYITFPPKTTSHKQ